MERSVVWKIPYEQQVDGPREARCGAAALCMVYRSLGRALTQAEIWSEVAQRVARGTVQARTQLLCRHALRQGLEALIVQARDPCLALQRCADPAVRIILNHRLSQEQLAGHYTVLVGISDREIVVHDPLLGPQRRLGRDEFLKLWQPAGYQVIGRVFLAVAESSPAVSSCSRCGLLLPDTVVCPCCKESISLRPASVLGCGGKRCEARTWDQVFCPGCDWGTAQFPFSPGDPGAAALGGALR